MSAQSIADLDRLPVHPAAEVFPILPDDELQTLADDIKANGQREPIVVLSGKDSEKCLLDGRNRLAACKLAGVEPVTRTVVVDDPVAFVLSSNIARRHMTKGQIAMVIAKIYPEGHQGKHTSLFNNEVSDSYVRQARAVLKWRPDFVEEVLSGESLSYAYRMAQGKRKIDERNAKIEGISSQAKTAAKEAGFNPESSHPDVIRTLVQIAECEAEGGDSIKLIKKLAKKRNAHVERQAKREAKKKPNRDEASSENPKMEAPNHKPVPPAAILHAREAIRQLEFIDPESEHYDEALELVAQWIEEHRGVNHG